MDEVLTQLFHLPSVAVEEDRLLQAERLVLIITLSFCRPLASLVLKNDGLILFCCLT